jgi:RHS repeat-associated protein
VVLAIVVSSLPGLLALSAQPASAQVADIAVAAGLAASPETPKQATGTAEGVSPLVDTDATATTAKAGLRGSEATLPKGALPRDSRYGAAAVERKDDDLAKLPGGARRAEQTDTALAAQAGPSIVSVYPRNGMLIDTLTPLLTAHGTSSTGGGVHYLFEICPVENDGLSCSATGTLSTGRWRVPDGSLQWGKEYEWEVSVGETDTLTYTHWTGRFVTGVRQPTISSLLSTPSADGQEFLPQTGNYTTRMTDATVATVGPPLSVVRWYNSLDPRKAGMFGAGWSTRWDMKVVRETGRATDAVLVTYPDGRQVRYIAGANGTFQPPFGRYDTLAVDGTGWRLMDKSSTSYFFDSQGRLVKIADARGRTQTLDYGADGHLAKVTGAGGRSLAFTWTGQHVGTVATDPVEGASQTWSYSYDGDKLTQVCSPQAAPNCTALSYTNGSAYLSAVMESDPLGYWRMSETTGQTATDLSGGVGDATYYEVGLGQAGALQGSTNTAAQFTAANLSTMMLPDDTFVRLGEAVSVEGWFKTSVPGAIVSIGQDWTYGDHSAIYVGTDGKLRGQYRTSVQEQPAPITSSGTVTDNAWHHVVLTLAAGKQTLYLDGNPVGTKTGSGYGNWKQFVRVGTAYLAGKWPAGPTVWYEDFQFTGLMDELAIYEKALSAEEVARHHAARLAVPHRLSKITLPSGRTWMETTYNSSTDRVATHTDANGGTWQIAEPSINASADTSTVTVTDPANKKLIYTYDKLRGLRPISRTDQLAKKTTYAYDTGGFLNKITDPNNNAVTYANDSRGNPLSTTTCRASGTCQTARSEYYLNASDKFDPRNDRVVKARDARSASGTDNTYATTLEYNQYGEQIKQTTPATIDFPDGRSATVAYTDGSESAIGGGTTPAGLVKTRSDPRGNSWSYAYNAAGDLSEQTDPAGLVTKLGYDALGRLTSSSKVSAAHPNGVTTTFTYDALGRVATVTGAAAKNEFTGVTHTARTTYGYDPDGNKLSEAVSDLTGGDVERKVAYGYDTFGRLESVTDAEGGVTRQAWNTLGQKISATDARGTVTAYAYSERGELTTTMLKGWTGSPVNPQPAADVVLESLSYDPAGRLASRVDAMGRKTSYTYYADNRLSQTIGDDVKLNGSTTPRDVTLEANTYDAAGNLTKQVTGGGKVTTDLAYDAAGRLSSKTLDPSGLNRKTTFTYDANNNVTKAASTGGSSGARTETKEYAYNKLNQPTKETVENGEQDLVSTVGYDDRGLPTSITDPRGNASGANAADYTTTMRYDELDRLVETVAPQVQIDKGGTASQDRPSSKIGYDTVGNKTHQRDAEGRTLTSAFDKAGRLISQSAPSYTPPGGTAVTPTTSHTYDLAGQLISTTDPHGYTTKVDYDQLRRQVRITDPAPSGQTAGTWVTEYDLAGEKLASVDPTGARTEATFDDLGRQITVTQVERKPANAAYTITMEYDDAGRLLKETAPGNKVNAFTVNAAGEITSITDPATNKTTMDYDLAGRLTKTTDPNGNATTAEYDLAGRKTAAKDLNGTGTVQRTFGYGYDPAGNPSSTTSPEGHVIKQTFDALNRVTSLVEPVSATESITTRFGYDATGARTRLTDGRGNATWTSYNSLGLAETVTEPATSAHPDTADRTWTHIYDAAGNPTATLQPGGVRIDRTFDHLNRLTKENGAGGGAATAERTFGYDLAGRTSTAGDLTIDYNDRSLPLKISRASVQESAYAYDALGNPTQRIDAAGTATFTYDNANRLATATDPVTSRTLTYGYDPANRLKTITATSGQASTQSFDYDAMDRLTGQTLKNGSGTQLAKITYGWDKDDNLTTKTTTGTAGAGTNTYAYDHVGRVTSWTAPGGATTAYEWDAAGNRTKAGNATFTYDERNRLTSGDGTDYSYTPRGTLATSTKAGATTSYTFDAFDRLIADGDSLYSYDALGRIASRIRGTAKQTFAYAGLGNDLAALRDSGGAVQAAYARDPAGAVLGLKEGTAGAVATLSDLHGDLVATYTTTLQTSTAYDPFGTVITQTGTKTQLGYQGEYTDPDTGKVNMHARWYEPGTGTFTSRDTATLNPSPSVQANRYTYANATPLTGTDPTGHMTYYSPDSHGNYVPSSGGYCQVNTGAEWTVACTPTIAESDPDWYVDTMWELNKWQLFGDDEIERLGYKVMPNGRPKEKVVPFWDMKEAAQEYYLKRYRPDLTSDQHRWLAALAMAETSDIKGLDKLLSGLPSGGNTSSKELAAAIRQQQKLSADLKACHDTLPKPSCKDLIIEEWQEWRELVCGSTPNNCKTSGLVETIASLTGMPLPLFKFLASTSPFLSDKEFNAALIKWAKSQGSHVSCNKDGPTGLTVCSGLKSGTHFGRSGMTVGGVLLTGPPLSKLSRDFINHEAYHKTQFDWYYRQVHFWPTFLVYYLTEPLNPCHNEYELQAEKRGVTYNCRRVSDIIFG